MLAERIVGESKELMDYATIPTTVFTPLEYGCCGIPEEDVAAGLPGQYTIYYTLYTPLEWRPAAAENEHFKDKCLVKCITDSATDKVVGLHLLGPHAGEMLQGMAVAMKIGLTKKMLDSCVGIHPTAGEEMTGLKSIKEPGEELVAKEGC
jgi:thioredoxin reductase (NADPH)